MTTTKKRSMSEQARAAKAIRTKLRATWPSITFSTTSESFAGGNAVYVSWTDGPTKREVDALIHWHEAGTFDGMTDSYSYDRAHPNIPQAKYVQTQRHISNEHHVNADAIVASGGTDNLTPWQIRDLANRITYAQSYVCRDCQHPAQLLDKFCENCGHPIEHDHTYA